MRTKRARPQGGQGDRQQMGQRIRIGVVAPGTRIDEAMAERVKAFAADAFLDQAPEIVFHPQCFLSEGHFAGDDKTRAEAFLDVANDPKFDALWVARGGYGACRMAAQVLANYHESARAKTYMGYSDAGAILAGLYKLGFPHIVHGPMPIDITREGGEAAVKRALAYLVERAPESLEMTVMAEGKCRFQHHDSAFHPGHAARTGFERPRADARRPERVPLQNRPRPLPRHGLT